MFHICETFEITIKDLGLNIRGKHGNNILDEKAIPWNSNLIDFTILSQIDNRWNAPGSTYRLSNFAFCPQIDFVFRFS
ncbi:MAG: hypothetical protein A2Z16_15205 [Chloroflexi bacterium RBG_16_54_18]|nr:MAG: hypothetical protein A2Z16_15205 [Chloroflexi bacterium RBG_16_54_18]